MAGRRRAAPRRAGALAVALALAAGCSGPGQEQATTPPADAGTPPAATPTPSLAAPEPAGPDAAGVIAPYPTQPEIRWLLRSADLDLPGAVDVDLHDPRYPPTLDGWPMVGIIDVGETWVVGAADRAGDRRWLVALDPATGESVATTGLTRANGPPSSCTAALANDTMACLYDDTLELVDPAAGSATARLSLDGPAHSVHAVDGDILLLGTADDGTAVELTRLTAAGDQQWSVAVDLDGDEALAMAGSYLPVVQSVPGLVLVGVGDLQLAADAATGEVAWQGIAEVLAPGPDGGLIASSGGQPDWGIPAELVWLDEAATATRAAADLSWRPPAANSGLVAGPVVADDGDAVVGLLPDGTRSWRLPADPAQLRVPMVRADGVVVLQDTAGVMTAVEAATGQVRWRNDAASKGWGARGWHALTDGERMVVRSTQGVAGVDLTDGSLAWQVDVPVGDDEVWELVALGSDIVAVEQQTITTIGVAAG